MKLLIVIFILLLQSFNCQFLKVEYNRINKGSSAIDGYSKEFNQILEEKSKTPQKEILYYANGNSFYKTFPQQPLEKEKPQEKEYPRTFERLVQKEAKFYHLKSEPEIYQYNLFFDEEFYLKDRLNFESIEYKNEAQLIDRYVCKLVEVTMNGGILYKVWFTEHLPISTGPLGFIDFPGLVLKVESPNFILYAVKVSNDAKESEVEKINPKIPILNRDEFNEKFREISNRASVPTKSEIRL